MSSEFEIRIKRNTWDSVGGWVWRVYELKARGESAQVNWGWAPVRSEAYTSAAFSMEQFEQEAARNV